MKLDYSTINSILVLDMKFRLDSSLRIGGIDTDNEEILRAGQNTDSPQPLIKDSSIRGILRSEFERLERLAFKTSTINVQVPTVGSIPMKRSEIIFGVASRKIDDQSISIKGALHVSDILFPRLTTGFRTMVSIDMSKRSVSRSGPFTQESINPSVHGNLELKLTNFTDSAALRILFFIIDEIGRGHIAVGGKSTSGLGRLKATRFTLKMYRDPLEFLGIKEPQTIDGNSATELLELSGITG